MIGGDVDVLVWILRAVLALAFLAAGGMKLSQPKDKLRVRMAWVDDFSETMVKAIGGLEAVLAVGLLIPKLTPYAAGALAVVMIGAVVTHLRRKEGAQVLPPLVLLALSAALMVGSTS